MQPMPLDIGAQQAGLRPGAIDVRYLESSQSGGQWREEAQRGERRWLSGDDKDECWKRWNYMEWNLRNEPPGMRCELSTYPARFGCNDARTLWKEEKLEVGDEKGWRVESKAGRGNTAKMATWDKRVWGMDDGAGNRIEYAFVERVEERNRVTMQWRMGRIIITEGTSNNGTWDMRAWNILMDSLRLQDSEGRQRQSTGAVESYQEEQCAHASCCAMNKV